MTPGNVAMQELSKLFAINGFTSSLGILLAIAMFVGALLNENAKLVVNWILALVVFGSLSAIFRYFVMAELLDQPFAGHAVSAVWITVIVFLVDIVGLGVGWTLAFGAKTRIRHLYQKGNVNQYEHNGGMQNGIQSSR